MPRTAHASVGGLCYLVLTRGIGRDDVFHKDGDFSGFVQLHSSFELRASSFDPGRSSFAFHPSNLGGLGDLLLKTKAFPIQPDEYLRSVLRPRLSHVRQMAVTPEGAEGAWLCGRAFGAFAKNTAIIEGAAGSQVRLRPEQVPVASSSARGARAGL